MTDSFAVHLGGGTYLDASGGLVFGPPSAAQIYTPPEGLRLDTKKIQETFKDLSDILPGDDEAKKKWMDWGVPKDLVNFLGSVAGVAGIVGTAISTYMWMVGVMLKIMDLLMADEGMSPELAKTLFSIKNQLQGLEQIQRADKMIELHSEFDGRIDRMRGLLTRLAIEKPTGATRAQIFAEMRTIVDELAQPLSRLRNQEWSTTYDSDAYHGRAHASLVLYIQNGAHVPIPMYPPNLTVFDYRLGVPMLLYGATTFTALIQIAMPWFRSAGMYAGQLRKTAEAIDRFVLRMQDECLTCTEHTAQSLFFLRSVALWGPGRMIGDPGHNHPARETYPVGAFDLVRYNDAFLIERMVAQGVAGENNSLRGLFNYDWYPPNPPITNRLDLEKVATVANEQAQQDYANMQVATGMLRLISTAAWLRFLSTPPDRSETVSGSASDSRQLRDQLATTATSPSIFPTGVIDHPATLKRYHAQNRIRIASQEPGYVPAFNYRIILRTIQSLFGNGGWDGRSYVGDVWQANYEPTQGDARCNRLRTELRQNSVLSEVVLYEGHSQSQPVLLSDEVNLRATTFDWYTPVVSPWSSYIDAVEESVSTNTGAAGKKMMVGSGGVSIHLRGNQSLGPPSMPFMRDPSPLIGSVVDEIVNFGDFTTLTEATLETAERRHAKIEDVTLRWQLNWTAGKLEVRLFGKPEDRPFQVHVVVEETVYSGATPPENIGDVLAEQQFREQIHTPFVAEIVNQIVFVPEEFFTKERKAIEKASRMLDQYARRFAEQRPVGPSDPIEFLHKSVRESIARSPSTSTLASTFDMRVAFAMRYAPELWSEVLMEADSDTASA